MGMTPQYFHTIPTSTHTTKLSMCTLAYSHPLNGCITTHQGTQHCSLHSFLHIRQPICAMFSSNKSSQHNWHFNMPYRLRTPHALHSFCMQDRPHLPCSVAVKLQPPTTWLLHAHQHVLYTLLPQHVHGWLHKLASWTYSFFADSTYLLFLPDIVQILQSLWARE